MIDIGPNLTNALNGLFTAITFMFIFWRLFILAEKVDWYKIYIAHNNKMLIHPTVAERMVKK